MKLSIIVACCENEIKGEQKSRIPLLKNCLGHIIQNNYSNLEVLVCSDGESQTIRDIVSKINNPKFEYHFVPKRGKYGGGTQRNAMMAKATGDLLMFIDDDDFYDKDAFNKVAKAAAENPGRLLVFNMRYRNGRMLWNQDVKSSNGKGLFQKGHIGTPMVVVPNIKDKLGSWGLADYSDGIFFESTLAKGWLEPVWFTDVIAHVRMQGDRDYWPNMLTV